MRFLPQIHGETKQNYGKGKKVKIFFPNYLHYFLLYIQGVCILSNIFLPFFQKCKIKLE